MRHLFRMPLNIVLLAVIASGSSFFLSSNFFVKSLGLGTQPAIAQSPQYFTWDVGISGYAQVVTADINGSLNLRREPFIPVEGYPSNVVISVPNFTWVVYTGEVAVPRQYTGDGFEWVQVIYSPDDGNTLFVGWVHKNFLR